MAGGRPKGKRSFAAALNIALKEPRTDGQEGTKLRQIADVVVERAIAGDGGAINVIADRVDGKPLAEMVFDIGEDTMDPLAELMAAVNGKTRSK